jgi:hypothetical protein
MSDPSAAPAGTTDAYRPRGNARDYLLPATFEERGATVPFTTPALAHARIRRGWRDGLELMIGDFAESGGAYVVPFPALRDLITLTTHDVVLCEALTALRAIDPESVREAALSAARTGLAGEDAAAHARALLAGRREALTLLELLITLDVIREVEGAAPVRLIRDVKTPDGQARARAALGAIAGRMGLSPEGFDFRLSRLAAIMYPLGLKARSEPGRLRVLHDRLVRFEARIRDWGAERLGEAAAQAGFAADVAVHALGVAGRALDPLDRMLERPFMLLHNWIEQEPAIAGAASRLAWVLDGWESIVEAWSAAGDQTSVLARLVPVLPLLPRDEAREAKATAAAEALARSGRRWVRANVDWRTGEIDFDLVERIEAAKARML